VIMLIYMVLLFTLPFVPSFDRAEAQPSWSSRRPREKGYWTGIGIARIDGELAAARESARAAALRDIAAQIATNLHGATRFLQTENTDDVNQLYRSEIRTEVEAQLERVELVDTWNDGENFWVYARLSIAEYQQRRRARIEDVRQRSEELCREAIAQEEGDVAAALSLYIRALGEVQRERVRFAELDALQSEIAARVQRLLADIELSVVPVESIVKRGIALDVALVVNARHKEMAIEDLPLDFRFILGDGQLDNRVWTGAGGRAVARLRRVDGPQHIQRVVVRIDLSAFAFDKRPQPFNASFAVFEFTVEKRRVYLALSGDEVLAAKLELALPDVLSRQGLEPVARGDAADLQLRIKVIRRLEQVSNELHFALLDVALELSSTDPAGAQIHRRIRAIKGAGSSRAQAENRACEKVSQNIEQTALPEALAALNH